MKISVCVTCWHKDVHFLPKTLELLKKQTFKPYEIIVVANNIDELKINDPDVKCFFVNERKPVGWSRNMGAKLATGDIVVFFDVDDVPHKQKLEATNHVFTNTDADCFVHGFTENEESINEYETFSAAKITELILPYGYLKSPNGNNDLHHGHLAAKRDIILQNPYSESLGFYELGFQYWGEDVEICRRLFSLGYKFYYSDRKLINYRASYKDTERSWYKV